MIISIVKKLSNITCMIISYPLNNSLISFPNFINVYYGCKNTLIVSLCKNFIKCANQQLSNV